MCVCDTWIRPFDIVGPLFVCFWDLRGPGIISSAQGSLDRVEETISGSGDGKRDRFGRESGQGRVWYCMCGRTETGPTKERRCREVGVDFLNELVREERKGVLHLSDR